MHLFFHKKQKNIYLHTWRVYDIYSKADVLQNTTLSFVVFLVAVYSLASCVFFCSFFSTMSLFFLSFFGSTFIYIIRLSLLLFLNTFPSFLFSFLYFSHLNLLFIDWFILSITCLFYLTLPSVVGFCTKILSEQMYNLLTIQSLPMWFS